LRLPGYRVKSVQSGQVYAYPREKSITFLHGPNPFTDQTHSPSRYSRANCRNQSGCSWMGKLLLAKHMFVDFAKLDRWIIQRIWSHRTKRVPVAITPKYNIQINAVRCLLPLHDTGFRCGSFETNRGICSIDRKRRFPENRHFSEHPATLNN
jgi:hypothetical protein